MLVSNHVGISYINQSTFTNLFESRFLQLKRRRKSWGKKISMIYLFTLRLDRIFCAVSVKTKMQKCVFFPLPPRKDVYPRQAIHNRATSNSHNLECKAWGWTSSLKTELFRREEGGGGGGIRIAIREAATTRAMARVKL